MIEVNHLTKRYGGHTAVDDLTFSIPKGQVTGFLGPNGAGKSTTMNIITGCLAATSGEVTIDGHDIFEEPMEAKRLVGYLPEQPPLYLDMTPLEYLTFVGKAKGLRKDELTGQVRHVMEETGLEEMARRQCRSLSKGYRQRVGIAQALLGNPPVVILDEPTVGLDPKQIIEIRDLVRRLGEDHTVILSSHILSEVQAVCGFILILSHGKLVASDTPDRLEQLFAGTASLSLLAEGEESQVRQALEALPDAREIQVTRREEGLTPATLRCAGDREQDLCREIFRSFCRMGQPLLQLSSQKASLEDVFLELTADQGQDPMAADDQPVPIPGPHFFRRKKKAPAPAPDSGTDGNSQKASEDSPSQGQTPPADQPEKEVTGDESHL